MVNDEQIDLVIYHKIICRGYEERFGMVRDVVRSEISIRLTKYLEDMTNSLRQSMK
ncbi:hypothetical protein LJK88_21675 [Paenibacillus sp. P26]|nr:hypothetical protein LJK88_21675 [Paenibacillus sp. P26]UUZ95807.1 hypothetical protein LJK87_16200 [Paenibacillus sp. P25]